MQNIGKIRPKNVMNPWGRIGVVEWKIVKVEQLARWSWGMLCSPRANLTKALQKLEILSIIKRL